MEGNRKLYYILMGVAVVLLTVSYGVGFYVGKNAGYTQAKEEFEVEKKKLLKTIASLTPLSRPKPEEKVVVVNANPETQKQEQQQKQEQEKTEVVKEEKVEVKTKKTETPKKPVKKEEKQVKQPSQQKKTEKVAANKNYFIQVGIFRSEINAKKLAKKLSQKGIPATVDKWKGYYRVKTDMLTQEEAKTVLKRLKEEMKLSGIIKRR